jgi:hypothetical protein
VWCLHSIPSRVTAYTLKSTGILFTLYNFYNGDLNSEYLSYCFLITCSLLCLYSWIGKSVFHGVWVGGCNWFSLTVGMHFNFWMIAGWKLARGSEEWLLTNNILFDNLSLTCFILFLMVLLRWYHAFWQRPRINLCNWSGNSAAWSGWRG